MALRQGHSTRAVLTNKSRFITLVENKTGQKNQDDRQLEVILKTKGTRKMHETTHHFRHSLKDEVMSSSTDQSFSGKTFLTRTRRPPMCPSLHSSKIHFGDDNNSFGDLMSINKGLAINNSMGSWEHHVLKINLQTYAFEFPILDNVIIHHHSSTKNVNSLVFVGKKHSSEKNFDKGIKNENPKKCSKETQTYTVRIPESKTKQDHFDDSDYNVISGDPLMNNAPTSYKKISGDKMLHKLRSTLDQQIIG